MGHIGAHLGSEAVGEGFGCYSSRKGAKNGCKRHICHPVAGDVKTAVRSRDPDAHRREQSDRGSPPAQRSEQAGPTEARRAVYILPLRRSISQMRFSGGRAVNSEVRLCRS